MQNLMFSSELVTRNKTYIDTCKDEISKIRK